MEREWRVQCEELVAASPPPPAPAPERYNLIVPRSRCPACGHGITAFENVPLLSYACLGGKCSACGARIGLRYPVVELCAGLLAAYCAARYGPHPAAFGAMLFGWSMLARRRRHPVPAGRHHAAAALGRPSVQPVWRFARSRRTDRAVAGSCSVVGVLAVQIRHWRSMGYGVSSCLPRSAPGLAGRLALVILLSSVVSAVVGILLMTSPSARATIRSRSVPRRGGDRDVLGSADHAVVPAAARVGAAHGLSWFDGG